MELSTDTVETENTAESFPPFVLQQIGALPYAVEGAMATASAIGGNPTFYLFESEAMTYYVRVLDTPDAETAVYYEGILTVPEGYTDAQLLMLTNGAGSGEIFLYAGAVSDNDVVFFQYYVYCDDLTQVYPSIVDETAEHNGELYAKLTEKWNAGAH